MENVVALCHARGVLGIPSIGEWIAVMNRILQPLDRIGSMGSNYIISRLHKMLTATVHRASDERFAPYRRPTCCSMVVNGESRETTFAWLCSRPKVQPTLILRQFMMTIRGSDYVLLKSSERLYPFRHKFSPTYL